MGAKHKPDIPAEEKKGDCESCKFNLSMDDEKLRCEFAKMLGKSEPGRPGRERNRKLPRGRLVGTGAARLDPP